MWECRRFERANSPERREDAEKDAEKMRESKPENTETAEIVDLGGGGCLLVLVCVWPGRASASVWGGARSGVSQFGRFAGCEVLER